MNPFNKRLKRGESTAFVELYDQLGEKIFRYVFAQLGSSQDASDVVQEVFVRLVKSHRSLAKAENLHGYVFKVARNETIRWIGKRNRNTKLTVDHGELVAGEDLTSGDSFENQIDGDDWVNSVLEQLDPIDREIVQLKVFSQLTFQELANVMELQQSNVATRYRRAIAKLETRLAPETTNTEPKT